MMLRLLEHYISTQGEGPNVGKLTQFIRFAGCNLTCPGWPCDTPYAINPKLYRRDQIFTEDDDLAAAIIKMYDETGAQNLCFTGGEPLLQPQVSLTRVIEAIKRQHDFECEIFTNGTLPIRADLRAQASFVVDWKLPGSGEASTSPTRIANIEKLDEPRNSVKFTVRDLNDIRAAHAIFVSKLTKSKMSIFVGPAWGLMEASTIVDYIKQHKLPWRLNIQVHNYIYGEQVRGI